MGNTGTVFHQVFAGDDEQLDHTVRDSAGVVVDISTASEITWKMATDEVAATASVTLLKSTGGVTFVTNGVDGQFRVGLSGVLTNGLDPGTYYQEGKTTLASRQLHRSVGTVWLRNKSPG